MTGMHENFDRREVKLGSDRGFGFVFAVLFALVAVWPLVHGSGLRLWALAIAAVFMAAALLRPNLLNPLNRLWFLIGLMLHRVVSPVVMGLIFVFGVVPTGLIMRAMGKDPLRLKFEAERDSYWIVRHPPGPAPHTMKKQF